MTDGTAEARLAARLAGLRTELRPNEQSALDLMLRAAGPGARVLPLPPDVQGYDSATAARVATVISAYEALSGRGSAGQASAQGSPARR